jgi:hypothetical protein
VYDTKLLKEEIKFTAITNCTRLVQQVPQRRIDAPLKGFIHRLFVRHARIRERLGVAA